MKVLIADDEKYVRYGLKSMLKELYPDIDIKEAGNGEEILTIINHWFPDIGLIDIKMPKLNGLEAIKKAKEISKKTKWVILTTYSKFSYAKEAITLDTEEYLLKPVKPSILKDTVNKIILKQKNENVLRNEEFQNIVSSLFNNISSIDEPVLLRGSVFYGCIIIFDGYLDFKDLENSQIVFCNMLNNTIKELISDNINIALLTLPAGELATIAVSGGFSEGETVKKYSKKIQLLSKEFNTSRLRITLFQTENCKSIKTLYNKINRATELSHFRVIAGIGRKIELDEIINNELLKFSDFCRTIINISGEYKNKAYLNFVKCIEILKKEFLKINSQLNDRIVESVKISVYNFFNFKIGDIDLKGLWIDRLQSFLDKSLNEYMSDEKKGNSTVKQVLNYIDNNYKYDISIAKIAINLNITPNYLSSLFHKNTGTTFIKYLTKIRMLKAKELLINKKIKINEVAYKVGYQSATHFTKLFKQYWGSLPSDFQN